MKTQIQFILAIAIMSLTFACAEQESKEESAEDQLVEEQTQAEAVSHEDHEMENMELKEGSLELNDGKPWEANLETSIGVRNMKQHMAEYPSIDDLNHCDRLHDKLKNEMRYIINKCTMKGQAHTQLHHYLYTIQKHMDGLSSKDLDSCQHSYEHINSRLAVYSDYFNSEEN